MVPRRWPFRWLFSLTRCLFVRLTVSLSPTSSVSCFPHLVFQARFFSPGVQTLSPSTVWLHCVSRWVFVKLGRKWGIGVSTPESFWGEDIRKVCGDRETRLPLTSEAERPRKKSALPRGHLGLASPVSRSVSKHFCALTHPCVLICYDSPSKFIYYQILFLSSV